MSFFVDALVVSSHTGDAIAFKKQFRASKSGEDRNAGLFHLAAQPLHKAIQGDHVVAVIAQKRRRNRELELAVFGKKVDRFFYDLRIEWSFLLKSRKQFVHRTWI